MEKQINLRLLDLLTTDMSTEQVERIRIHVEILIDGYHKAQTQVSDLELELASVRFDQQDRRCCFCPTPAAGKADCNEPKPERT